VKKLDIIIFLGLLTGLPSILSAVASVREVRHFFPEAKQVPVAAKYAKPSHYYGSDLYSRRVEGPRPTRYGIEIDIAPLFFINRDASDIDGRPLYYGFTTSIGMPLSKIPRHNHYLNLELLGAFDRLDYPYETLASPPTLTNVKIDSRMISLLVNYRYYTPALIRDRFYPYLTAGLGNSFKSEKVSSVAGTLGRERDTSILTMQGGFGFRARISDTFGIRTGYHMLFIGDHEMGGESRGSDFLHALDLGLNLHF